MFTFVLAPVDRKQTPNIARHNQYNMLVDYGSLLYPVDCCINFITKLTSGNRSSRHTRSLLALQRDSVLSLAVVLHRLLLVKTSQWILIFLIYDRSIRVTSYFHITVVKDGEHASKKVRLNRFNARQFNLVLLIHSSLEPYNPKFAVILIN